MKRKIFTFFLCCIFNIVAFSQSKLYNSALFGEHVERVTYDVTKEYHIHLDMNGDFYPNYLIPDANIKGLGNNQLKIWAKKHPNDFKKLAESYQLIEHTYSEKNYQILQDSIIKQIVQSININSKEKTQTWLIHGFRKNLYQEEGNKDRTSLTENISVKKEINKYLQNQTNLSPYYVEIYWDGLYRKIYSGLNNHIKLAKTFKQAIPNAQKGGYSLRDVINKLENENINIVTHSTGTHIGTNILFNVLDEFEYEKSTPSQNIKLILVASASSGKKLFENYYTRITPVKFEEKDNYTVINVYNKKDGILRKNLLLPGRANTRLGCDYRNESGKLAKFFKNKYINSKFIERKITYEAPKRNWNHIFYNYVQDKNFINVFSLMY